MSRWGRFQDADESAYYEYTCKEAGIQVQYCAEQFENDGSLISAILKNLKRVMAAEFSRELSNKVFVGSCRLARLGFRLTGTPYGLRRQLIDESGVAKTLLERGQRKSLQTEHIILTPGPRAEVRTVRRIFTSYAIEKKSKTEIAAELNADRILRASGEKWRESTIRHILTNEAYIGNNVYNQTSSKLKQRRVTNPPDMWIRHDGAFQAIVAPELFAKAREIISKIVRRPQYKISDQEALRRLSALNRDKGRLSLRIIIAAQNVPSRGFYTRRFGSLAAAYDKIGYQPESYHYTCVAKVRSVVDSVAQDILKNAKKLGARATFRDEVSLLMDERWTVSIYVAWSVSGGVDNSRQWKIKAIGRTKSDHALLIRMDDFNAEIRDYYYLVPPYALLIAKNQTFPMSRHFPSMAYEHNSLDEFYQICALRGAAPLGAPE